MTPTVVEAPALIGRQRIESVLYPESRSTSWLNRSSAYASGMLIEAPVLATAQAMPFASKSRRTFTSPSIAHSEFAFSSSKNTVQRSASTIAGALSVVVKSIELRSWSGACRLFTRSFRLRSLRCTSPISLNSRAFLIDTAACFATRFAYSSSLSLKCPPALLITCSTPRISPSESLIGSTSILFVLYPVFLSKEGSNLESA
mmetsp:Transcript_7078/g.16183  ORF Transcript_7078/g.16183 Transcript_7078/m.16183 type:complete len:202 (-) Transcript_7078:110-715(-)